MDKKAKALYDVDKVQVVAMLTDFSVNNANELVYHWKKFYQYLFMKYMDGNIKTFVPGQKNPKVEQPGYGDEWYRRIVKETGDKLKVLGEE